MRFSLDLINRIYYEVSSGKAPVPEYSEWLEALKGDTEKLVRVFNAIRSRLIAINTTVLYPQEFIVIPRYPFSKKPLIPWLPLKDKDPNDRDVMEVKEFCSRAGKLINTAVIAKHLVVLDIDANIPTVRELADVKTRRGYHLVFYVPKYEVVKVYGQSKYVFRYGDFSIEFISGSNYLWSFPLQSRWLEFVNGVANVRLYKIISNRLEYALSSGDLTPITATIDEVESKIRKVLETLGLKGYAKSLTLEGVEKESNLNETSSIVNPKQSKFNANPITALGGLSLTEFVKLCSKVKERLPVCVREALLGTPIKGSRYFHLRLLLAILPFFVSLTEEELEYLAEDFGVRTSSRKSEIREWIYGSKYFTGRANGLVLPSKFGVPEDAWSYFRSAGYCSNCPAYGLCRGKSRRGIVEYLTHLLEGVVQD